MTMHKDAKNYDKALALIDSSISDQGADFMIKKIGDSPANGVQLAKEPDALFQRAGNPARHRLRSWKTGIFQRRSEQGADRQRLERNPGWALSARPDARLRGHDNSLPSLEEGERETASGAFDPARRIPGASC